PSTHTHPPALSTLSLHDALPISLDRVLAGHGVGDEQDLDRVELFLELLQFDHELFVNVEPPGCVDQEHVASVVGGLAPGGARQRSEEHTSELQSPYDLVCRLLLE